MIYIFIIALILVITLSSFLIKTNSKLNSLNEENNALKEALNAYNNNKGNLNDTHLNPNEKPVNIKPISPANSQLREKVELIIEDTIDIIEPTPMPIKVEFTPSPTKNEQQHYYIVQEIIMNKISNAVVSTIEYEFANTNLHTSKVESRLFYDNKIAILSNNDANSIIEYQLYIANNVFFDAKKNASTSDISTDEIKTYLLIDGAGKVQTDGRNFESFALSEY